jgi:hypothetical protein
VAFAETDGINLVAKTALISGPLVANRRGENQPFFDKWGENMAYSPQEQKRMVLWVILSTERKLRKESEPV